MLKRNINIFEPKVEVKMFEEVEVRHEMRETLSQNDLNSSCFLLSTTSQIFRSIDRWSNSRTYTYLVCFLF